MFSVDDSTTDKEQGGIWVDYQGSSFLVAHINNPTFQRIYTRLQLPHRKAIEKSRLDPDIQLTIMSKSLAKGVLLDWKDVVDKDDKPVVYSLEAAEKVFRQNSQFREFITEVATDLSQFVEEEKEELGKEQEKSSAGP